MARSNLSLSLLSVFAIVLATGARPVPVGSSGDDGAVGGACQGRATNSVAGGLICVAESECATACTIVSLTVFENGVELTRKFCKCSGTAEPECCHIYILSVGGVEIGPQAFGKCGGEKCNGNVSQACALVPLAVPDEVPPKFKAACQ